MDGKSLHQCAEELVLTSDGQVGRQLPVTVRAEPDDRDRPGREARR